MMTLKIQFLFLYRQEWILVSCLRHHRRSNSLHQLQVICVGHYLIPCWSSIDPFHATEEAEDAMDKGTPVTAEGDEKKAYDTAWKNYPHRISYLALHRVKVNALIMGQCQPSVMERINTAPTWDQVVANADHLGLMQLIQATVIS